MLEKFVEIISEHTDSEYFLPFLKYNLSNLFLQYKIKQKSRA